MDEDHTHEMFCESYRWTHTHTGSRSNRHGFWTWKKKKQQQQQRAEAENLKLNGDSADKWTELYDLYMFKYI